MSNSKLANGVNYVIHNGRPTASIYQIRYPFGPILVCGTKKLIGYYFAVSI
jgi:hypothetical protein